MFNTQEAVIKLTERLMVLTVCEYLGAGQRAALLAGGLQFSYAPPALSIVSLDTLVGKIRVDKFSA